MLYLIEGNIGGGKTFYVVSRIVRQFYNWDPMYQEYFPKDPNGLQKVIFTNVAGLKLGDVRNLDDEIKRAGGLTSFFGLKRAEAGDYQRDEHGDYLPRYEAVRNSIIIVDEAHFDCYFPKFAKLPGVVDFMTYSRHFGCDIYLLTQDSENLWPALRRLPEYTIQPARQSLQLGGFRYKKMIGPDCHGTMLHKYDKRIFDLYKSVVKGAEIKKEKSVLWRYVKIGVAAAIFFAIGWHYFLNTFRAPDHKQIATSVPVVSRPVPTSETILQTPVVLERPTVQKKKWRLVGQVSVDRRSVFLVSCGRERRYITNSYLSKYCSCNPAENPPMDREFAFNDKDLYYLGTLPKGVL